MTLRIVFVGCVDLSHALLRHLLTVPEAQVVGVITKVRSAQNSDFRSLEELATAAGCPVLLSNGKDHEAVLQFIATVSPDVTYCFGWSHLLPAEVLAVTPLGAIGYHPAALPANRGRHPIVWALALGLTETASTFFQMEDDADAGSILDQVPVSVAPTDDAAALYEKLAQAACRQLGPLTAAIAANAFTATPQRKSDTNTWRKRGHDDGKIDWRMSAQAIHDLVRALSRPYVGAHCEAAGETVRVWRVELGPQALANLEPGKVLEVADGSILVKCWDRTVRLVEHEFGDLPQEGSYL